MHKCVKQTRIEQVFGHTVDVTQLVKSNTKKHKSRIKSKHLHPLIFWPLFTYIHNLSAEILYCITDGKEFNIAWARNRARALNRHQNKKHRLAILRQELPEFLQQAKPQQSFSL